MRCQPEADTYKEYDTKETKHQGFVRFSFALMPGEWMFPEPNRQLSLGEVSHD